MRHEPRGAGRWYPDDPIALRGTLRAALGSGDEDTPAVAVWAPLGPYAEVGALAGAAYAGVEVPPAAIVVAPSPRVRRAIGSTGSFLLPGDEVPIASHVAEALRNASLIPEDLAAFDDDLAIEAQLPFLRARNPLVEVVPVLLGDTAQTTCGRIGGAIADVVVEFGREVLVVGVGRFEGDDEGAALGAAVRELDPEAVEACFGEGRLLPGPDGSVLEVTVAAARALGASVGAPRGEPTRDGEGRLQLAFRFTP